MLYKIYFLAHHYHVRLRKIFTTIKALGYNIESLRVLPSEGLLKLNPISILRLLSVNFFALVKHDGVILAPIESIIPFNYFLFKKTIIIDYATPFSVEVKWLGYKKLSDFILAWERKILKQAQIIFVPNELMFKRVMKFRTKNNNVFLIPNYPPDSFVPKINASEFKKIIGIDKNTKIALFSGSGRLREIYGLDLLLKSWKIVESKLSNVLLIIVGPRNDSEIKKEEIIKLAHKKYGIKNILVTGWIPYTELPNWINIADICLAPRTPGFPKEWYNDKDSTKISEYAALGKPIVACGYMPSSQYFLTEQTPEAFAEGILLGFNKGIKSAIPHFWSENIKVIKRALEGINFEKRYY